jgi:chaperonin cofactor prefoldin
MKMLGYRMSFAFLASSWPLSVRGSSITRYKIGDSFFTLPLPEVQELVSADSSRIDEDVAKLEEKLGICQEEMSQLKVALYGRFGRSINLET